MDLIEIRNKKSGNCPCFNCGTVQAGYKLHPLSVYIKKENQNRGLYFPVCCEKCAKEYIKRRSSL